MQPSDTTRVGSNEYSSRIDNSSGPIASAPVARSSESVPDRYVGDDGEPLSIVDGVAEYRYHRVGQRESRRTNGYQTFGSRARLRYARVLNANRVLLKQYDDPTIVILTLAGSHAPADGSLGPSTDYLGALGDALQETSGTLRYRLTRPTDAEYVAVAGGTGCGVPHWHLVVWVDRTGGLWNDDGELWADAEAVVRRFQRELPERVREVGDDDELPEGAVRTDADPGANLRRYPGDSVSATPIARYVGHHIPHLGEPDPAANVFDGMNVGETRMGLVADSFHGRIWRTSQGLPAPRRR